MATNIDNITKFSINRYSTQYNNTDKDDNFINIIQLAKELGKSVQKNKDIVLVKVLTKEGSYHNPPEKIPDGFCCISCGEIGPHTHTKNCIFPTDESLYKYSATKGCIARKNMSYKQLVLKRGVKGQEKETRTFGNLPNNIYINYRYPNTSFNVVMRIFKTGKITKQQDNYQFDPTQNKIINMLVKKINKAIDDNENILTDEWIDDYGDEYTLRNRNIYEMRGEFRMFGSDQNYIVNLHNLDNFFKAHMKNKTLKYKDTEFLIPTYNYSKGGLGVLGQSKRNMITFYISKNYYKIYVQIERKGGVEFICTVCKEKDSKEKKCLNMAPENFDTKDMIKIFEKIGTKIHNILESQYYNIVEPTAKQVVNKIEGLAVGRAPKCIKSSRPIPYSFYGKCDKNKFISMPGKKTNTGYYEPCCGLHNKENYINNIIYGFPRPPYKIGVPTY